MKDIESKLVQIADPEHVLAGTVDADEELHKLGKNLIVLVELIAISGKEVSRLDYELATETAILAKRYDDEYLSQMSVVKSNKFSLIKMVLARERKDLEDMKVDYRRFRDLYESYVHLGNVYKKTREIKP